MQNFTYWVQNLIPMSMQGYENVLGVFVWPLIFMAITGYVYLKQQSAVAAAVCLLILFAAFGNVLMGIDPFMNLMHILISLVMTALILIFISKYRR